MKTILFSIVVCFISPIVSAQTKVNPGGVQGAIYWFIADNSTANPSFRNYGLDSSNLQLLSNVFSVADLNFHPALVFNDASQVFIPLKHGNFNNASFFTVYKSTDTATENNIWYITKNQQTELITTTHRTADLTTYDYMNYMDIVRKNPKVNIYIHNKPKDVTTPPEQTWYIGRKPSFPQLPISSFKGLIPEIIAFDRVLSSQERIQVASYLSVKYGITLSEPTAIYLNSAGEKMWDGQEYTVYHNNIAGIGRDDSSGLDQKTASSSNVPGLLTLSARESFLNNTFLLWGDNGMSLREGEKIAGIPKSIEKKWLMVSSGNKNPYFTDVMIDTKQLDLSLPAKPVYWLAIDRSGTGDFNSTGTEYIKMTNLDVQGKAHFNGVVWGKDSLRKEIMGITVARDILLATYVKNPTCFPFAKGSLIVKALGGKAPYRLIIKNNAGQLINQLSVDDNQLTTIPDIITGKYVLVVTDALQRVYTDSFYVNNSDAPQPKAIASTYTIPEGSYLKIDASENMPDRINYQWTGPDNFHSSSPSASINRAGLYLLTTTNNGCSSTKEVLVRLASKNIFDNKITIYPNPSPGLFIARISLDEPAPVRMEIYTAEGKLITSEKGEGFANYQFVYNLLTNGVYELVFSSGQYKTSRSLVIVK